MPMPVRVRVLMKVTYSFIVNLFVCVCWTLLSNRFVVFSFFVVENPRSSPMYVRACVYGNVYAKEKVECINDWELGVIERELTIQNVFQVVCV